MGSDNVKQGPFSGHFYNKKTSLETGPTTQHRHGKFRKIELVFLTNEKKGSCAHFPKKGQKTAKKHAKVGGNQVKQKNNLLKLFTTSNKDEVSGKCPRKPKAEIQSILKPKDGKAKT